MWRPKGWENPFPKTKIVKLVSGRNHKKLDARNYYYEAGADAMLEALKSKGIYNYSGFGRVDFPNAREGWFTFIPEG